MSDMQEMMDELAKCGEELQGIRHAETPSELASSSGSDAPHVITWLSYTSTVSGSCVRAGRQNIIDALSRALDEGWDVVHVESTVKNSKHLNAEFRNGGTGGADCK